MLESAAIECHSMHVMLSELHRLATPVTKVKDLCIRASDLTAVSEEAICEVASPSAWCCLG